MFRSVLFITIYLLPFFLQAQKNPIPFQEELVYPIRKDHKIGYLYIKDDYTTICPSLPPKFDYIGETPIPWNTTSTELVESSFRLFSIDEKVGLIDHNLKEVIPNNYKRIRPISDDYFAVEIDSDFVLIDRSEKVIDTTHYQNICSADAPHKYPVKYLFVQQGNLWGVKEFGGAMLLDFQYADISSTGEVGFYKVRKKHSDDFWQLINVKGESVLPKVKNRKALSDGYQDIKVLDKDLIGVKYFGHSWDLFKRNKRDENGSLVYQERDYTQLWKINESVVAFMDSVEVVLYNIEEQKVLTSDLMRKTDKGDFYPRFQYLDDKASIRVENQSMRVIVDNQGVSISPIYRKIEKTNQSYYYKVQSSVSDRIMGTNLYWSLINYTSDSIRVLVDKKREIFPLQHNMALTYSNKAYGLTAIESDSVIARLNDDFANITIINENEVTAQLENQALKYILDRNKKEFVQDLIIDAQNVSINKSPEHLEANVIGLTRLAASKPKYLADHYKRLEFKYNNDLMTVVGVTEIPIPRTFKVKRVLADHASFKTRNKYHLGKELSHELIGLYHERDGGISCRFTQDVLAFKTKQIEIGNSRLMKINSSLNLIGIRKFNSDNSSTAFIDATGKMGLLNKKGEELKNGNTPIRFTYIAPFVDGKAAACLGGRLELNRGFGQVQGFKVMDKQNFLGQFNIKKKRGGGKDAYAENDIYFIKDENSKWVYIDDTGKILFETEVGYAHNFHEANHTAIVEVREDVSEKGKVMNLRKSQRGVIDFRGKTIIQPEYNAIERYENFYIVSKRGTPTFSFNEKGHQIYKNRTRIRPFSEDVSVFRSEDEKWGYLDNTGEIIIPPDYTLARPFSEGKALVKKEGGELIFINKNGEEVFSTGLKNINQWRTVGDFKEGRCWFKKAGKSPIWGVYDAKGKVIIEPKFFYQPTKSMDVERVQNLPMDFSNGIAAVQIMLGNGDLRAGIIDSIGNWIMEPKHIEIINRFDQFGYATFKKNKKNKLIGLIKKDGKIIFEPKYTFIDGFVNGYARVRSSNNDWGLIDMNGREVIPVKYMAVDSVAQELVAVKYEKDKWRYLDLNNTIAIRGPFESTQEFVNGITMVVKDGKKKIIGRKGEEIRLRFGQPLFVSDGIIGVAANKGKNVIYYYADASGSNLYGRYFNEISPFKLSSSSIKQESKVYDNDRYYGAINKRGISIVPPKFKMLHLQPDGTIIINPQEFKGLVSTDGKIILPVIYDQVIPIQSRTIDRNGNGIIFRVEIGEAIGYYRVKDNVAEEIWELQK